jgi:hypothetical protein
MIDIPLLLPTPKINQKGKKLKIFGTVERKMVKFFDCKTNYKD